MAYIILKVSNLGKRIPPEVVKNADGSIVEFADNKQAKIYQIENELDNDSIIIDTNDPNEYANCFMAGTTSVIFGILTKITGKTKEDYLSDKPPVSKFN